MLPYSCVRCYQRVSDRTKACYLVTPSCRLQLHSGITGDFCDSPYFRPIGVVSAPTPLTTYLTIYLLRTGLPTLGRLIYEYEYIYTDESRPARIGAAFDTLLRITALCMCCWSL